MNNASNMTPLGRGTARARKREEKKSREKGPMVGMVYLCNRNYDQSRFSWGKRKKTAYSVFKLLTPDRKDVKILR